MIQLKSEDDLKQYRLTGKIAAEVLTLLKDEVKSGVSTYKIAKLAEELIIKRFDAIPSSIGQHGFKFALNSSINNVVCHGVPNHDDVLKDGDIVNLDVTVKKHGWIADTSRMYLEDDWTVVTKDGKLSAQWEHTVAVTDTGCEILTLREEEKTFLSTL